jgi:hypothetical protein
MLKVSDNVRSTHSQDGGILLDIRRGRIYGLNFAGSRILELLRQNYEEAQIPEEISRQFGISLETAAADVREFLDSLEKHKIVERSGTAF